MALFGALVKSLNLEKPLVYRNQAEIRTHTWYVKSRGNDSVGHANDVTQFGHDPSDLPFFRTNFVFLKLFRARALS